VAGFAGSAFVPVVAAGLAGSAGFAGVAGVACANALSEADANSTAIRAESFFIFVIPRMVMLNTVSMLDCAGFSLVAYINAAHYTGVDMRSLQRAGESIYTS
jgi:hypothetical protein